MISRTNLTMDSCRIWSLALSVKASFSFQREVRLMRPKLMPRESHLVSCMPKVLQIWGFYVAIARLNSAKHVLRRHFTWVKLVSNLRHVKAKSNLYFYCRKCRFCEEALPLGYTSGMGIKAFDDICESD
jgi:hypothetical protein